MKILVVADTHIPASAKVIPPIIMQEAQSSDICLHAGDLTQLSIYQQLSKIVKTYAVYGNMDDSVVRKNLPQKEIIKADSYTIGLTHGAGAPKRIFSYLDNIFKDEKDTIDIFVFGHTHKPLDIEKEGKIYFNPGSCTDIVFAPYNSYGIIEIEDKTIKRSILKIE